MSDDEKPVRADAPARASVSTDGTVTPPKDVIMVGGPSEDGHGVSILRMRENRVEAGELRVAAEGKPISGELVRLSQRQESERLFDVEVLAKAPSLPAVEPPAATSRKGPAKVASDAYRHGWEGIFGASLRKPDAGGSDLN